MTNNPINDCNDAVDVAMHYKTLYDERALKQAIEDWMDGWLCDSDKWTVKAVLWQIANW